jgi:hypothetical protein
MTQGNQESWKQGLNLPKRDDRVQTEDVTNTKGAHVILI